MKMKYIKLFLGICLIFFTLPAWAQDIWEQMEFPSSPNPIGSGARAIGMGGAFIAITDDATAASWNPGGLIQLEDPELSIVFDYVNRRESIECLETSEKESIDIQNLNYFSAAYPFTLKGRNMVVSLNYQHLYDFHRDWHFSVYEPENEAYKGQQQYDYEQNGGLYALGLAYCAELTPSVSAGITLNFWDNFLFENRWEQKYHHEGTLKNFFNATSVDNKYERFSFSGWNINIGFLWKISEHWTLGGVLKTPFTADIEHTITEENIQNFPDQPDADSYSIASNTYDDKLKMPMSYGMGVAYRFSDNFTISGDIYRTHWDEFEYEDWQGNKSSPISGKEMNDSDIDPTTWFRLGGEYLMGNKKKFVIPICAGMFYDPAPGEGSPDDYYGISLGTGFACIAPGSSFNRYVFDIAYQFRFGGDVEYMGDIYVEDVREHTVYASLIIHF